ncbi:Hypothetical protein NTJ_06076 [Nesidiocoris tenuis]|uniref:Uncharacterized protein n=1 Tax=Nesidiocoris tenuis TaxID=355587 RepID=A0ABN7AM03_9HEMI|nr:Hypothetical protein NTJ_06076 [Nesidiocoris tenuis]
MGHNVVDSGSTTNLAAVTIPPPSPSLSSRDPFVHILQLLSDTMLLYPRKNKGPKKCAVFLVVVQCCGLLGGLRLGMDTR